MHFYTTNNLNYVQNTACRYIMDIICMYFFYYMYVLFFFIYGTLAPALIQHIKLILHCIQSKQVFINGIKFESTKQVLRSCVTPPAGGAV